MSREHEYEISPHLGRREGSRGVDCGGRTVVRPRGPPKVFQVVRQVPRDTTVYLDTTGSCYTQPHLNFFLGLSLPALCIFRLPIHLFCLSRSKGRGELMTEKDPARRPGRYANLVGNVMSSLGCAHERAIGKRNRTIFFFRYQLTYVCTGIIITALSVEVGLSDVAVPFVETCEPWRHHATPIWRVVLFAGDARR